MKQSRLRSGLTQWQVADQLDYQSAQFVSNWERGLSQPPSDKIAQLAELYDIPVGDIANVILSCQEEILAHRRRELCKTLNISI